MSQKKSAEVHVRDIVKDLCNRIIYWTKVQEDLVTNVTYYQVVIGSKYIDKPAGFLEDGTPWFGTQQHSSVYDSKEKAEQHVRAYIDHIRPVFPGPDKSDDNIAFVRTLTARETIDAGLSPHLEGYDTFH